MATNKATAKNNDETTDDTAPVASGEQKTSDSKVEVPTEVQDAEDADNGFEEDGEFKVGEDSLGSVREGGKDVPWTYLTPDIIGRDEKVRTSDSDDAELARWNVQHTTADDDRTKGDPVALVPVTATPGQTFTADELPNIESLEKAGINVTQFLAGLPVRDSLGDDEKHRRGIPA